MICPACGNNLSELNAGAILVDVCRDGCAGIWFDQFELTKVDEPHEPCGPLLAIKKKEGITVDPNRRYKCPKCQVVMMRHFWSEKRQVLVDECPGCGGFFLDGGELADIRAEHEAEVRESLEKYLATISIEDRMKAKANLKKIAGLFGVGS